MLIISWFFILFFVSFADISHQINNVTDQLLFAQVIYRHGDRNIDIPCPNDPWKDEKHWPGGLGSLTNLGKQQLYDLGQFFRERYKILLGNGEYSPKKVYIQSSDSDRAIMSAAANLAGLFPPEGDQIWSKNISWQPTAIHTIPSEYDHTIRATAKCDRFDYLDDLYWKQFSKGYEDFIKSLEHLCGRELPHSVYVAMVWDSLEIEIMRNYTIPEWARRLFYPGSTFQHLAKYFCTSYTRTPEISRLKFGYLLQSILKRFEAKIQSKISQNLWIYSGHDYTIASLLNIFGVYSHKPPFASALMFELYQSGDDHYIQIFYKHSSTVTLMDIPGCGTKCTLERYYSLFRDSIPTEDYKTQCKLPLSSGASSIYHGVESLIHLVLLISLLVQFRRR